MIVRVRNKCEDFNSYRAARVKSLFNPERGCEFSADIELPDDEEWGLGVIVGPSGTGKTSAGRALGGITDLYAGWSSDAPIVDAISGGAANGGGATFDEITGSLAAVGLGDVPSWLRPFNALSNGQQFRAGLARLICEAQAGETYVVDEFTSVVDRQIAKIGAMAFAKSWKRNGSRCVLLSCHYDILDWLEPDWVYDTGTMTLKKARAAARGNAQNSTWKLGRSIGLTGSTLSTIII